MAAFTFDADVIHWRGPAPYYFAAIPSETAQQVAELGKSVSYGWGVIPVTATIDGVTFRTSLIPRHGGYLLPLKDKVRAQLGAAPLVQVRVAMTLG
jgi:hypothetical protein